MRQFNTVDPQPSTDIEPPAPNEREGYVRRGPGSWQPLGLVIQRVIGRIVVEGQVS